MILRLPLEISHWLIPVRSPYPARGFVLVPQIVPLYRAVLETDDKMMRVVRCEAERGDGYRVFEILADRSIVFP